MSPSAEVRIPRAIYEARETGSLTPEQFDIYFYAYHKADWREWRVRSYSAECVCHFRGLDATTATLKRYQRAGAEMIERNLARRDYRKLDPKRTKETERTYSLWVPPPQWFDYVGTPEENLGLWSAGGAAQRESLYSTPVVALLQPDNVALPVAATPMESIADSRKQTDTVCVMEAPDTCSLSFPNQGESKAREIAPKSPTGDFSPFAPSRGNAQPPLGFLPLPSPAGGRCTGGNGNPDPAGGQGKPLASKQCDQLKRAALLYADFSNWLYGFVPNVDDVASLLRAFKPIELLFAQFGKLAPGGRVPTKQMAHFFKIGAKTLIEAARVRETATSQPNWAQLALFSDRVSNQEEFLRRWKDVQDAWRDVSMNPKDSSQDDDYLESLRRIENRKQVVKQFLELVGLNKFLQFTKDRPISDGDLSISYAIQKAEDNLGESISWSVLLAVFKHRAALCNGDTELFANFGKTFIDNLVSDIRALGLQTQAPEQN